MKAVTENTLSDRVLKWIVDSVNPNAKVQSISRLHGGISSIVHSVSLKIEARGKRICCETV